MIIFAGFVFFLALALLVSLFTLKIRERESGAMFAPELRAAADREALHLKELLAAARLDLKKVPPLLVHWGHRLVHFAALEFARAARAASREAHKLADFVSHRRTFQKRETRSEFLRKMSERRAAAPSSGQQPEENVQF